MLGITGRVVAVGLGVLGIVSLVTGCSDGDAGVTSASDDEARGTSTASDSLPAVPWSTLTEVVDARQGEYREALIISAGGADVDVAEEWLVYDLDASIIERRVALHYDLGTGDRLAPATREEPSLGFIYDPQGWFMMHPSAEADCGTPWVRMRPEDLEATAGIAVDPSELLVVPPIETLRAITDPGPPVENDEDASVYAVTVPGGTGIRVSSSMISNPELADRISSQVQTAEIRLPRDGGPIEVTIDLTNLVAAASARPAEPDMAATLEWTVTAPVETVDITVPTDAADRESCA